MRELVAADVTDYIGVKAHVEDAMTHVWDARGTADIAKIKWHLMERMSGPVAGVYLKEIERELRRL